jgi:hypothetical protein
LITGISGAQANHAKKQTKNAIQVRWNARIGGVEKEKSLMLVALLAIVYPVKNKKASAQAWWNYQVGRTPLSVPVRRWTSFKNLRGSPLIRYRGMSRKRAKVAKGQAPVVGRGGLWCAHHRGAHAHENDAVQRETRRG